MEKDLYILGGGGHGKVVADVASCQRKYNSIFFLDDVITPDTYINNFKVIGKISDQILSSIDPQKSIAFNAFGSELVLS